MAGLPPKVRVELVPLTVLLMVVVPLKVNVEPVPLTLPLPGSELSPIVVSPLNVIAEPEPVETPPSIVAVLLYVTVELVPVATFPVTVAGPLLTALPTSSTVVSLMPRIPPDHVAPAPTVQLVTPWGSDILARVGSTKTKK